MINVRYLVFEIWQRAQISNSNLEKENETVHARKQ